MYYAFGKFAGMFGVWVSDKNYDGVLGQHILVYKDNVVTKHSEKYMRYFYMDDMTRIFYEDDVVKKETIFTKLLKVFKKVLSWI